MWDGYLHSIRMAKPEIELKCNGHTFNPQYPVPRRHKSKPVCNNGIQKMLQEKATEPADKKWAIPILFAHGKDGSLSFVSTVANSAQRQSAISTLCRGRTNASTPLENLGSSQRYIPAPGLGKLRLMNSTKRTRRPRVIKYSSNWRERASAWKTNRQHSSKQRTSY